MSDSSDDSSGPPPLEEAPVVTNVEDDSSEDGPPPLEGAGGAAPQQQRQTKGEKKARKAIQKLGLKPVEGITRVVLKQSSGVQYVINTPDVFRGGKKDTFVVFGVAQGEDASQNAFKQAASSFGNQAAPVEEESSDDDGPPELVEAPAAAASDGGDDAAADEGDVDETGVSEKDIGLVMAQVSCTRAQAVKALKKNNNDIVNSIMSLSF